jgi:predicted amino acid racemase
MFLRFLTAHNPELIDYGVFLLEHRRIDPDTYVLDIDRIEDNARRLRDISRRQGISLYFMAKQIGRNPEIARRVLAEGADGGGGGFTGMVAVDFREAGLLHAAGLPVKHIGHLCQIPRFAAGAALDMAPEYITIYSVEKGRELSEAAQKRGIAADLLLRVWDEGDIFYQGQEGGFSLQTLGAALDSLETLPGIRVAGITSFPCFLYDEERGRPLATPNAHTLRRAAAVLEQKGFAAPKINMPSCNSLATIPLAAELGATHAEPGHSLTGTNPDNLLEERPLAAALLYMSEISHQWGGRSFCFGGGHYRRSKMRYALVKAAGVYRETAVAGLEPESIDYHFSLDGLFPIGSPVCMAFRTQIFVTRSRVALVEGLARSRPSLLGVWDSQGRPLNGKAAE